MSRIRMILSSMFLPCNHVTLSLVICFLGMSDQIVKIGSLWILVTTKRCWPSWIWPIRSPCTWFQLQKPSRKIAEISRCMVRYRKSRLPILCALTRHPRKHDIFNSLKLGRISIRWTRKVGSLAMVRRCSELVMAVRFQGYNDASVGSTVLIVWSLLKETMWLWTWLRPAIYSKVT